MNMTANTMITVRDVRIVRLMHSLTLWLIISGVTYGDLPLISRMRSKMTIVSLTEYPMMVMNAETIVRSILKSSMSSHDATLGSHSPNQPPTATKTSATSTSCTSATTAAKP